MPIAKKRKKPRARKVCDINLYSAIIFTEIHALCTEPAEHMRTWGLVLTIFLGFLRLKKNVRSTYFFITSSTYDWLLIFLIFAVKSLYFRKEKYWYLNKIIFLYEKENVMTCCFRRGGPFWKYLSSPFSSMFRRPWCICQALIQKLRNQDRNIWLMESRNLCIPNSYEFHACKVRSSIFLLSHWQFLFSKC